MRNKYHCAVIDMRRDKTIFEFDTTTLKGLTLDNIVERIEANGAEVETDHGYDVIFYKNGKYYGALYMHKHKSGGIFTMPL